MNVNPVVYLFSIAVFFIINLWWRHRQGESLVQFKGISTVAVWIAFLAFSLAVVDGYIRDDVYLFLILLLFVTAVWDHFQ